MLSFSVKIIWGRGFFGWVTTPLFPFSSSQLAFGPYLLTGPSHFLCVAVAIEFDPAEPGGGHSLAVRLHLRVAAGAQELHDAILLRQAIGHSKNDMRPKAHQKPPVSPSLLCECDFSPSRVSWGIPFQCPGSLAGNMKDADSAKFASWLMEEELLCPCCLLLILGIPASGKTLLARAILKRRTQDTAVSKWIWFGVHFDDFYPPDTRSIVSFRYYSHA